MPHEVLVVNLQYLHKPHHQPLSSRLKLHHPTPHSRSVSLLRFSPIANSPLRPLLVQYPMSTFYTPNRVALFQWNFLIAIPADVVCGKAYGGFGWGRVEGGLRRGVGFAGHGEGF